MRAGRLPRSVTADIAPFPSDGYSTLLLQTHLADTPVPGWCKTLLHLFFGSVLMAVKIS